MAGEKGAGILDLGVPFDQGFNQVPQGAEDRDQGADRQAVKVTEMGPEDQVDQAGGYPGSDQPPPESLPGFIGTDGGGEFSLPQIFPGEIGPGVVQEDAGQDHHGEKKTRVMAEMTVLQDQGSLDALGPEGKTEVPDQDRMAQEPADVKNPGDGYREAVNGQGDIPAGELDDQNGQERQGQIQVKKQGIGKIGHRRHSRPGYQGKLALGMVPPAFQNPV